MTNHLGNENNYPETRFQSRFISGSNKFLKISLFPWRIKETLEKKAVKDMPRYPCFKGPDFA